MTRKLTAEEFVAHVDQLKFATRLQLRALVLGIVMECAEGIIVGNEFSPGTPVDTGFARASWWIALDGDGTPPTLPPVDTRGRKPGDPPLVTVDPSAALLRLLDFQLGQRISLNNNAAYIVPLEHGHSQQAPQGMVAQVINALPAIVAKVRSQQQSVHGEQLPLDL